MPPPRVHMGMTLLLAWLLFGVLVARLLRALTRPKD
jgi:hypothetical protein